MPARAERHLCRRRDRVRRPGRRGLGAGTASQIAGTLVFALTLIVASPYRIRPTFERGTAATAIREGRGFLAQSGLSCIELNADSMSVGGFLGSAQLGYYSMAFRVAELPYWAITEPVAKVTFPGFTDAGTGARA